MSGMTHDEQWSGRGAAQRLARRGHWVLLGSMALVWQPTLYAQQAPVAELAPVSVTGASDDALPAELPGGQTARGVRAGILGNRDTLDLPFSMSSYTSRFLENQQASKVADALAYDPSVSVSQTGGMVDSYAIRGFSIGEGNVGEMAFDGVYGVAPNYRVFTPYVERVEVLKGATGLLYGMSPDGGVGGVINIVPKRAGDADLTRFTANYASDAQVGGHLDVGRRFGPDQRFGLRFNGSHAQGDTAVDNQKRRESVGALALDYRGERLRATLDLLAQRETWDAPSRVYRMASGVAVPDAPDGRTNPAQPWGWSDMKDRSALLGAEYDLNDNITLFASGGYGYSEVTRYYDQLMIISNAAGDFSSVPTHATFEVERNVAQAGMRARFATGPVRHAVALQVSGFSVTNHQATATAAALQSNIYHPVATNEPWVNDGYAVPRIARTRLSGVALSDTLSFFDERLQAIVGLRHQRVRSDNWDRVTGALTSNYRESAITPSLGLVLRPSTHTMVYASYIEGLSKGDTAPTTAINAGQTFAPYKSRQYEVGFKVDYGRVNATVSAFQIAKPSGQLLNGYYDADAEQRNRGLELSVQGEAAKGVRLVGGVMLLDPKLTRTSNPATVGNRPVGAPRLQASLGAEWDTPWLPGFTVTGGVVYAGRQYVDQQNTAALPAWTRVDLGARYETRLGARPVTLRANVQNLFNRHYWSGVSQWSAFALGSPRTVTLSAAMSF